MTVTIVREAFDTAVVRRFNEAVHEEYLQRYGGGDPGPMHAADFEPPAGGFFIAYDGGQPVASGAWRSHGRTDAEMKRLYVTPQARGRGLARRMVAWIEQSAAAAGKKRLVLVTGDGQPEAIALYESLGYHKAEPYGVYQDYDDAKYYGKILPPVD